MNKNWVVVGFDREISKEIMKNIARTCGKDIASINFNEHSIPMIKFQDGTILRWLPSDERAMGYRYTKLFCNCRIDTNVFETILAPQYLGDTKDIIWL